MARRGPKNREIDYKEAQLLASIFCSEEEIAERLEFSYIGFRARKKRDKELVSALKRGKSDGIRSLRALQFQAAKKGNVTMQIWLGKQVLGQTDRRATALSPETDCEYTFIVPPALRPPSHKQSAERSLEAMIATLNKEGYFVSKLPGEEAAKAIMGRMNRGFDDFLMHPATVAQPQVPSGDPSKGSS